MYNRGDTRKSEKKPKSSKLLMPTFLSLNPALHYVDNRLGEKLIMMLSPFTLVADKIHPSCRFMVLLTQVG